MSEQQMTPAPRRIRSFQALRRPAAIPSLLSLGKIF